MRKSGLILLLFLIVIFSNTAFAFLITISSNTVFTVAPPPSPICYISGTIVSVELRPAEQAACLDNCEYINPIGTCCPTDTELQWPERYYLSIRIDRVSYINGSIEYATCENAYPLNKIDTFFINAENLKLGDSFPANKNIEFEVSNAYVKKFDSYLYPVRREGDIHLPDIKIVANKYILSANPEIESYLLVAAIVIILLAIFYWMNKKK